MTELLSELRRSPWPVTARWPTAGLVAAGPKPPPARASEALAAFIAERGSA